jgi:prephenate dehydrogenase
MTGLSRGSAIFRKSSLPRWPTKRRNTEALAGPGLRSMTRLAGSPFHIWRDIFKTSSFLPGELQSYIERLQRILDSMEAGNFEELEALFKRGGSE